MTLPHPLVTAVAPPPTSLQAGYNQITSVPGELGRLSRLAELHLACNRLETLPPDLGRALPPGGALTELGLSGNPLGAPLCQV